MDEWFRRMNFFKGFFTQAEDWQAGQDYLVMKHWLHSQHLHTPGVAWGALENLRVTATEEGTGVYVAPGYAIDGEGRDLFVPQPQRLQIRPQEYSPPATVYIIIRYAEEKVDSRPNATNPEYSGHAFVEERPLLDVTTNEPDNRRVIELARVSLSSDVTRLRNPRNAQSPGQNEIDVRFVQRAGAVRSRVQLSDIGQVVREGKLRVRGSSSYGDTTDDENVLIERIEGKDAHRYYIASVYPVEETSISWRIEASYNNAAVEYRLYFNNRSQKAAEVFYRVYSFS
jgi:hypothetical protein